MRGLIEYSDELRPSSSHRTPDQIADDAVGPIGGFPDRALMDEQARLVEQSIGQSVASGAEFSFLRARSSINTLVRTLRRRGNENP